MQPGAWLAWLQPAGVMQTLQTAAVGAEAQKQALAVLGTAHDGHCWQGTSSGTAQPVMRGIEWGLMGLLVSAAVGPKACMLESTGYCVQYNQFWHQPDHSLSAEPG